MRQSQTMDYNPEKKLEDAERNLKTYKILLAIVTISFLLISYRLINQPLQPIAAIIHSPTTRVEVCINMSGFNSNSIHVLTGIPYNSSIPSKKYGFATYAQFKNWSSHPQADWFGLEHNNFLC